MYQMNSLYDPDLKEGALICNQKYEIITQIGSGGFGNVYSVLERNERKKLLELI